MNKNRIQIALEDFPDDVYVLLEDEFRADFFKTVWKTNRSYRHLARKIGVSAPTMLAWRRNKDGGHYERFISIKNLKNILEYCKNSESPLFDFRILEKNVKCIRARHGQLRIYKPKLPIKDSVELREIVTHLLCDGYASNKKHMTSKYGLTSFEGVKEFQRELSIFGDIPGLKIREYISPKRRAVMYNLHFPKAITKILSHKFKIGFGWNKGRLPQEFVNGDRKLLAAIVRAFFIDEGSIHDLSVKFSSNNPELLNDLKIICLKLGYKTLPIRHGRTCYVLPLSNKNFMEFYTDIMNISPLPIVKKQNRLELGLKLLNKKYIHFDIENQIVNNLRKGPMTRPQLCELIVARRNNIIHHLNRLNQKNIIQLSKQRAHGQGGGFIWELCR